jgi:hypothetical protein
VHACVSLHAYVHAYAHAFAHACVHCRLVWRRVWQSEKDTNSLQAYHATVHSSLVAEAWCA